MTSFANGRAKRGVAALEFALCAPLLFTMLAAISDLGFAMRSKMLLAGGIGNAASYAILTEGAATAATLTTIVQDTSTLTGVQVTVSTPACYCASGTPATLVAVACGTDCASGALAGTYTTISANYSYVPLIPGYSFVANTALSDSATVQVK